MTEYRKPTTEAEFLKNFKQKKPLMNSTEAAFESARCLFCYDAPCVQACPTGIDIPLFIKQIHTQNALGAAQTIYDANWLGNACGVVCPTSVLCEGACVYNHQEVPPIQIGRLQNYATNQLLDADKQLFKTAADNNRKVAIVGAGPAGIACACELRTMGYQVDIFEAKNKPSGLTVYGIAPYKISNEEVFREVNYLQKQFNFHVNYDMPIRSTAQLESLEDNYDAIFLGVGIGRTADIEIKGEELNNVIGAVEYIEELRMQHHETHTGDKVIVIGGGNTAMDAASEAARMGADEVILAYRRDKASMGAYRFEYDLAISAGVDSLFNVSPVEIMGHYRVEGVKFVRTQVVDGRLSAIAGSEFIIACDMVIKATGQAKQGDFYQLIPDLATDTKGRVSVNEHFQTTNPQYFAGGDAINGGAEVVNAAYDGKMAARGIDEWLNNKSN